MDEFDIFDYLPIIANVSRQLDKIDDLEILESVIATLVDDWCDKKHIPTKDMLKIYPDMFVAQRQVFEMLGRFED